MIRLTKLTLPAAIAASLLVAVPSFSNAGAVVGSTEFTQIANNIQLAMSYAEQVETALNSARQYKLMVDQLKRNPGDFAKGMLGGSLEDHLARADDTLVLIDTLENLSQRTHSITDEWQRAQYAIQDLGGRGIDISPASYYDAMAQIAEDRGGEHEARITLYRDNLQSASDDVARVNRIVERSEGMTTEIQGLQSMVASQAVIANLLQQQIQMTAASNIQSEQDGLDAERSRQIQLESALRADEAARRAYERDFGASSGSE